MSRPLPADRPPVILSAHPAYRIGERLAARQLGMTAIEVRTLADLEARIGEADVLLVSGLWRNALLEKAPRLAFVQSISAGTDQYDRDAFRAAGVRLASAQGSNEKAVAAHAMALMLSFARRLPEAAGNQARRHWRPMIGAWAEREDDLAGRTLVIVGMGRIGQRLARLARAFDMHVVGVKRDPDRGRGDADEVVATVDLQAALARADYAVLTCPLTAETRGLIDAAALAALPRQAVLINVARGPVVVEAALIDALQGGRLAGAALDTVTEEPLVETSPLWTTPNLLITPHSGGETRRYEDNVLDLFVENLARLARGEATLVNGIV